MSESKKIRVRKHIHNLVEFQVFGLDDEKGQAAGWGYTLDGQDTAGYNSQDAAVEAAHREIEARK